MGGQQLAAGQHQEGWLVCCRPGHTRHWTRTSLHCYWKDGQNNPHNAYYCSLCSLKSIVEYQVWLLFSSISEGDLIIPRGAAPEACCPRHYHLLDVRDALIYRNWNCSYFNVISLIPLCCLDNQRQTSPSASPTTTRITNTWSNDIRTPSKNTFNIFCTG